VQFIAHIVAVYFSFSGLELLQPLAPGLTCQAFWGWNCVLELGSAAVRLSQLQRTLEDSLLAGGPGLTNPK
jgi:hypothetical protein